MGQRFHRGFTAAEKTELWDRWKRGKSLRAIGRAFGKPSSSIYFLVAPHGGIRPAEAPPDLQPRPVADGLRRHTRYVMLAKVAGKDTQTVISALIKQAKKLPVGSLFAMAFSDSGMAAESPSCCPMSDSGFLF